LSGTGWPVLRLMMPGKMLVKAVCGTWRRPLPIGPIAERSRKRRHSSSVSQYRPAPPRTTVLLSSSSVHAKPNAGEKLL
jgi:hypothetical protein